MTTGGTHQPNRARSGRHELRLARSHLRAGRPGHAARRLVTLPTLVIRNRRNRTTGPGWPVNQFVVDHDHELVFIPVPKAANSSMRRALLSLMGHGEVTDSVVPFMVENGMTMSGYSPADVRSVLDRYFVCTVVREPFPRLVSAYLNKFVDDTSRLFSVEAIEMIQATAGRPLDLQASVSFQEFVRFVCATPDDQLDPHWRSQTAVLGGARIDLLGHFEDLPVFLRNLGEHVGAIVELPHVRRTTYGATGIGPGEAATLRPAELESLAGHPTADAFATPELTALVADRFADDRRAFGYPR